MSNEAKNSRKGELKIPIKGLPNVEAYVCTQMKGLKGKKIESVSMNEQGELVISYVEYAFKYPAHYSVKQISKKKYATLTEWFNTAFRSQENRNIYGFSNQTQKWVIETPQLWLVFFEN